MLPKLLASTLLFLATATLSAQDKPHLTPENVLGKVFPRDTFKDIRVAVVGYCGPAPILQKYQPVTLPDQYFFLVPFQCVQVCTHNGIKFLSISHIYGGAPSSALVEDLAYYGIDYILAYGFAGGLGTKGVKKGDLYLVNSALVRDGTTSHYTKDEVVYPDAELNKKILSTASKRLGKIHSLRVMTDDAIYQEYERDLDEAVAHNCDIVNLDCTHLFAASKHVGISATQFGVVSNAREPTGVEETDDLAYTLISDDTSAQNPLTRVNDVVQFYVETLLPELMTKGTKMKHTIEHQKQKYFVGLELRTNNDECSTAMPAHKDRFFNEHTPSKIRNKVNGNILALYTDYEGDYSKPYSWILGYEVSSLDDIPEGLVGKVIPASTYAVFTTQGEFPQGLIAAWQAIWNANLPRAYTSDFEVYRSGFDPQTNPQVKVYIAIDE